MVAQSRWSRVNELVQDALELPPGEREAFVERACSDDEELKSEVRSLLAACSAAGDFLEVPVLELGSNEPAGVDAGSEALDHALPDAIGEFRPIRLINAGGMGVVYLAEQQKPRRQVAIKLVRPELASPEIIRRFDTETEILGKLKHPGIAQVYGAGIAKSSFGRQPFLAMEFIDGKPITQYAEEHGLTLPERLQLVRLVCEAVHHAHERGVIHRDLKPDNVLIDTTGRPKVLDFGVARLTDSDLQATFHTQIGELVGTLAYMSPEQTVGNPKEVDARSDVYSLGVLCYELLSGRRPYQVRDTPIPEAIRVVQEREPDLLKVPGRSLRKGVNSVLAKALAKAKDDRYQTAAEFAEDIGRLLRDEPTLAQPLTFSNRLRRFRRRHKLAVTVTRTVVGTAIFIVGISAAITWLFFIPVERYYNAVFDYSSFAVGEVRLEDVSERSHTFQVHSTGHWGEIGSVNLLCAGGSTSQEVDSVSDEGFPASNCGPERRIYDFAAESLTSYERWNRFGRCDRNLEKGGSFLVQAKASTAFGAPTEEWSFNWNTTPVDREFPAASNRAGWAIARKSYDTRGNLLELSYRDPADEPTITTSGFAGLKFGYDTFDNMTSLAYSGADSKPVTCREGYAIEQFSYERGDRRELCFFDTGRRPTHNNAGIACVRWSYHDNEWEGTSIEERYYDLQDNPTWNRQGAAGYNLRFDSDGRLQELISVGENGAPTPTASGVAGVTTKFDDKTRPIQITFIGPDGDSVSNRNGVATIRVQYDDDNNVIEDSYFDVEGRVASHRSGYSVERYEYPDWESVYEYSYLNGDREPTVDQDGVSILRIEDDSEQSKVYRYLDDRRQPVLVEGRASLKLLYNDRGQVVEVVSLGPNGEPVVDSSGNATVRRAYDELGRVFQETYFDEAGARIADEDGIAGRRWAYDERSRQVEEWYLGLDDALVVAKNGAVGVRFTYDGRGNRTREQFLAPDKSPVLNRDGVSATRRTYNRLGLETLREFLGLDGQPVASADGVSRVESQYNNKAEKVAEIRYALGGEMLSRRVGPFDD